VVYSAIAAGPGSWIEGERGRFMAGDAPVGESPTVRRLLDSADAVSAAASAKAAGAVGIKIYNTIPPHLVRIVATEARRKGLRVWSHLWVDPGVPSDVLAAGAEVVSHGDMFVAEVLDSAARAGTVADYRAARATAYADTGLLSRPALRRLVTTMKERDVILDPTLYVMRPGPDSAGRVNPLHGSLFRNAVSFVRAVHRAGVDVAAGTDAIGGSTPNLHVELQLLVDSVGMTPLQAIRAGTYVSARALGIADSVGTIAVGKLADLVVLAADPSVDIANTITVVGVMRAGRYYARERPMSTPPGARAPARRNGIGASAMRPAPKPSAGTP
jgi:imidazolonepropionase-like amidohydrolase